MGKIKIYEIAKEIGLTSKEIIEKANELGIEAKSHMSGIEEEEAKRIKAAFSSTKTGETEKKEESKKIEKTAKKETKKNVVPAISTYKLRHSEIYYNGIRVMPSYIMTGGNILIEKSKVSMATEDIATMLEIIK